MTDYTDGSRTHIVKDNNVTDSDDLGIVNTWIVKEGVSGTRVLDGNGFQSKPQTANSADGYVVEDLTKTSISIQDIVNVTNDVAVPYGSAYKYNPSTNTFDVIEGVEINNDNGKIMKDSVELVGYRYADFSVPVNDGLAVSSPNDTLYIQNAGDSGYQTYFNVWVPTEMSYWTEGGHDADLQIYSKDTNSASGITIEDYFNMAGYTDGNGYIEQIRIGDKLVSIDGSSVASAVQEYLTTTIASERWIDEWNNSQRYWCSDDVLNHGTDEMKSALLSLYTVTETSIPAQDVSGEYDVNIITDNLNVVGNNTLNFNVGCGDKTVTLGTGDYDTVLNFISDTSENHYISIYTLTEDIANGSITITRKTGEKTMFSVTNVYTDKLTITDYISNGKGKVTFEGVLYDKTEKTEGLLEDLIGTTKDNYHLSVSQNVTAGQEFQGSWLSERIIGTSSNDVIYGNDGDDYIDASKGNDTIYGGEGNDYLAGGKGSDTIHGGNGNDTINEGSHLAGDVNTIYGGAGDDAITVSGGFDDNVVNVYAEEGNDTVYVSAKKGQINLFDLNSEDTFIHNAIGEAEGVTEYTYARDGQDLVITQTVTKDETTDVQTMTIKDHFTRYAGGTQIDTVTIGGEKFSLLEKATINVTVGAGETYTPTAYTEALTMGAGSTIQLPVGTTFAYEQDGNDLVLNYTALNTNNNQYEPNGKKDIIKGYFDANGAIVDESLQYKVGDSEVTTFKSLFTGAGEVVIDNSEATESQTVVDTSDLNKDVKASDNGDDITMSGNGEKKVTGGAGDDTIDLSGATGTTNVDLNAGGENTVTTGAGENTITAGSNNETNIIKMGTGEDDITLGDGNNTVEMATVEEQAVTGADKTLTLGAGQNEVSAKIGSENKAEITITGAEGKLQQVTVEGGTNNTITVQNGNSSIATGSGSHTIDTTASSGNTIVNTTSGDNTISTGSGADTIYTGKGTDVVNAGSGDDTIIVRANSTKNTITGGAGADTFRFISENVPANAGLMMMFAPKPIAAVTEIADASSVDKIELPVAWENVDIDRTAMEFTTAGKSASMNDLIISYNEGMNVVLIKDFFQVNYPVDNIRTIQDPEQPDVYTDNSIKSKGIINVTITENNSTYEALGLYKENITVAEGKQATVTGLVIGKDAVYVEDSILTRAGNSPDLVLKNGETQLIIDDFFNMGMGLNVNNENTSADTKINVTLDGETYTPSNYTDLISGTGSVSNLGANDKIVVDGTPVYSRVNDGPLVINTITVTDFNWDGAHNINVNNGTTEGMTVNVTANQNYTATSYKENINATANITITGMTKGDDGDTLTIGNEIADKTFKRTAGSNNLLINSTYDVTLTDYFLTIDMSDVTVDGDSLADMSLNVALNTENAYAGTRYNETFTGSGSVSKLGANDKIAFAGETTYAFNGNGLTVTDNTSTVLVTDYATNRNLAVLEGVTTVNIADKSLTVTGLTEFDGSTYGFKDYDITGTDAADTLTGGANADTITGGEGDDTITGGAGNDTIYGGAGDDIISGGAGENTLKGGSGNNTFEFNHIDGVVDTILDAKEGDTLKFNDSPFSELRFSKYENDLEIEHATSDRVVIKGFFEATSKVDTIITSDSETPHSIKDEAVFNIELANDAEWDKANAGYTGYKVKASLRLGATHASVSNIEAGDELVSTTANIKRSGNDLVLDSITVKDYYTSKDMSVAGQYASVKIGETTLGGLNVLAIEKVSDIIGTDNAETIRLVTTEDVIPQRDDNEFPNYNEETGKYTSNAGHGEIKIDAYAAGLGGNDVIDGTEGNDWINGGDGNDIIRGGISGKDMLSGGDGENEIMAGKVVEMQEVYNTDGVEIYGGSGKDTIKVGGNDSTENYIWAHGGDDNIILNGGKNTIMLVEDDMSSAGNDTITGATSLDTLKFVSNTANGQVGYSVADMSFAKGTGANAGDLVITIKNGDEVVNTVTLSGYFDEEGKPKANVPTHFLTKDGDLNLQWLHSNTAAMFGQPADAMYNVDKNPDAVAVAGIRNWINGQVIGEDGETIFGADKYDMLAGTQYDDKITAGSNGGELYGDAGNDTLIGSAKADYIRGNEGNDTLTGNGGEDIFMVEAGNDIITDAKAEDTIKFVVEDEKTFDGITFVQDGTSLKIANGGVWSATLENYFDESGNPNTDVTKTFILASENGQKEYTLGWHSSNAVDYEGMYLEQTGLGDTTAIAGIPNWIPNWINSGAEDDTVIGANDHDMLAGNAGNNTINAVAGAEVYAENGNDTINAAGGNFIGVNGATGEGHDTINLENTGNNTIWVFNDTADADAKFNIEINGANSTDKLKFNKGTIGGYHFSDLAFNKSENDLVISIGEEGAKGTVTVKGYFDEGADRVKTFQTLDGTYTLGWHSSNAVDYEGMYLEQTGLGDTTAIAGIPNWIVQKMIL